MAQLSMETVLEAVKSLGDLCTVEQVVDEVNRLHPEANVTSYNDTDRSRATIMLTKLEERGAVRFNGSYWELVVDSILEQEFRGVPMFPLIVTSEEVEIGFPDRIPWRCVEPYRMQLARNHSQNLERLAERGGLAVEELYVAAHGLRVSAAMALPLSQEELLEWLTGLIRGQL